MMLTKLGDFVWCLFANERNISNMWAVVVTNTHEDFAPLSLARLLHSLMTQIGMRRHCMARSNEVSAAAHSIKFLTNRTNSCSTPAGTTPRRPETTPRNPSAFPSPKSCPQNIYARPWRKLRRVFLLLPNDCHHFAGASWRLK